MVDYGEFRKNGLRIVKDAIEEDEKKNYEAAYKLYILALDNFMFDIKYEKNENMKIIIREKTKTYIKRAEDIKRLYLNRTSTTSTLSSTLSSSLSNKKQLDSPIQEHEKTEEQIKIISSLESLIISIDLGVKFNDVIGLEEAKETINQTIIYPLKRPELYVGKLKPRKCILFYGPPGTGKTHLVKAIASETNHTFFNITSASILSKWQGDSEKTVRALFMLLKERKPSILFIDEIDSVMTARSGDDSESSRRVKTQFLTEIEGVNEESMDGVVIICATNIPWILDGAFLRRFNKRIYIGLPDKNSRKMIFRKNLEENRNELESGDFDLLAELTEGYSGSDISKIVSETLLEKTNLIFNATHFKNCMEAGKEYFIPCSPGDEKGIEMNYNDIPQNGILNQKITLKDLQRIIKKTPTTVNKDDIIKYQAYSRSNLN